MEPTLKVGLQKRDDKTSILKYVLHQSRINNSPFTYDILDNSKYETSFQELTHNEFNILDCEKEYSRIIGITLYNESYSELESTLISIFENRLNKETNGMNCLSKSLVIIIADGYKKLDPKLKEKFSEFSLYDKSKFEDEKNERKKKKTERKEQELEEENKAKSEFKDNKEQRISEDTTFLFQGELAYTKDGKTISKNESSINCPNIIKLVFAVKYKNKGKLHSHLLLLMLCCKKLKPEYVILLDTGTIPHSDGINILINAMNNKKQLSGCCGELYIDTQPKILKTLEDLTTEYNQSLAKEKKEQIADEINLINEDLVSCSLLKDICCSSDDSFCAGFISGMFSRCQSFAKYFGHLEASMILKAQWLEYKFAHSLQKTFDSSCGFIPVLPGAFCAYRWSALAGKDYYVLKEYLKPFSDPDSLGWMESNIYFLAEDRVILDKISKLDTDTVSDSCWSSGHFLEFIRDSKAKTDGPNSILRLINQRRRWNNGAWFSLNQTLFFSFNTKRICCTKHSPIRKLVLILQLVYYNLVVIFQWCSVGAYYLAYSMALRKITSDDLKEYIIPLFEGLYLIVTFCLFCISLVLTNNELNDDHLYIASTTQDKSNKNLKNSRKHLIKKNHKGSLIFNLIAFLYFLSLAFILFSLFYVLIFEGINSFAYIVVIILVPSILILSLLVFDIKEIYMYLICAFPYLYYIPTYINILQIYAICKTDDVSWGTRISGDQSKYDKKAEDFKYKKFVYLVLYVFCNSIFGFLFERFYQAGADNILRSLYGGALILICTPFCGELYYMLIYCLQQVNDTKVNPTIMYVNQKMQENENSSLNNSYV